MIGNLLNSTFLTSDLPRFQQSEDLPVHRGPNRRLSRNQLFWILQSGGWVAFGAVMLIWGLNFMPARDALVNKVLLVAIGLVITLFLRRIFRNLRTKSRGLTFSVSFLVIMSFSAAAAWRETHSLLFQAYSSATTTGLISLRFLSISVGTFLYDGFVLLAWSLLYFAITSWMELEQQRARVITAEARAQAARLQALQSQLEPHFLFNTLNAISTLVVEGRNTDAARMITRLSDFLRLTLETADAPEISLAEELEFVRSYLQIEQVRFGSRLEVAINAEPEAQSALVPVLILQPLIENAVKHGVLTLEEGGFVSVNAARRNGSLRLSVTDNGPGITKERPAIAGVGLRNTINRLHELYGDAAHISFASCGGLQVTIDLPFRKRTVAEHNLGGVHA